MKKIGAITLLLLLAAGPATAWATALDAACSESHHGGMMQAMGDCHMAPCCSMAAPVRGSGDAPEQLKRATSIGLEGPKVQMSGFVTGGINSLGGERASPTVLQATHVLRR